MSTRHQIALAKVFVEPTRSGRDTSELSRSVLGRLIDDVTFVQVLRRVQFPSAVHEAYLRLVDIEQAQQWDSRRHFFSAAAEAMRRILVEKARYKARQKHGGGARRVKLDEHLWITTTTPEQLLAVDEALSRLALEDPIAAEVVKLRYFAGMSIDEAAEALEDSPRDCPSALGLCPCMDSRGSPI